MKENQPKFRLIDVEFFERDVRLRMPFRFGIVTLTEAPQTYVRAHIRTADGREGWGMSAELLAPKWFDKSPDQSNQDNFDQLRRSLAVAAKTYCAESRFLSAFGLHVACAATIASDAEAENIPSLAAGFGPALLDRAILDALLRIENISLFEGARRNVFGLTDALTPDLAGFDLDGFLAKLHPSKKIAARHTVGLVDPIESSDQSEADRVGDGLPETLGEVIRDYGVTYFKLKVGGDINADLDRLTRIARVLDRLPDYKVTLDGNEQYNDVEGIRSLWTAIKQTPALNRLCASTLFVEQPISRAHAFDRDITSLAKLVPVEIDESDGSIGAFPLARDLGYTGVSSKSCKGFYKSVLNCARCANWNEGNEPGRYFMSAEDLTTQAGLSVQEDLALATLIGCTHVERNGHHYVDGMSSVPKAEQQAFLKAHPDIYTESHGSVRLRITDGNISIGSLETAGYGSAVLPDIANLQHCEYKT
ncbi:mandelate racemase [Sneathiella litorea]|uniref:Mandelate racemase n=1 Tax=Sneathiella litorea TaxID=2606216 RepID=A0A6L8W8Z2_9PROT|nr:mandelate racemase [Sneathiella litorea]MZR30697.1 mandelate racemase [Sneathiella litorea]